MKRASRAPAARAARSCLRTPRPRLRRGRYVARLLARAGFVAKMPALRALLEGIESLSASVDDALPAVAYLVAEDVGVDADELNAARRRALLLLAAGGDPRRELDAGGRAARSLAADLETPERTERLHAALARAREQASGLPHVGAAADFLMREPDAAWRWVALALLAEELTGEA